MLSLREPANCSRRAKITSWVLRSRSAVLRVCGPGAGGRRLTRSATMASGTSATSRVWNQCRNMKVSAVLAGAILREAPLAPRAPHRPVGVFHVAREARLVHERRGAQPRAQRAAQLGEARAIGRMLERPAHVLLGARGDPVVEPERAEDAGGAALHRSLARERQDRHPHPPGM